MRVTATPMIGRVKQDRTNSLIGCHALIERRVVEFANTPQEFDRALARAVKELLLADRVNATTGQMNIIITLELEENGL